MSDPAKGPFLIWKKYRFDAAHHLKCVDSGHPCGNVHGHTYRVRVECAGPLDAGGMVVDYSKMDRSVQPLIDQLDHSDLNEVLDFETTAENLARWFYENLEASLPVCAVEVCETEDSGARYPIKF